MLKWLKRIGLGLVSLILLAVLVIFTVSTIRWNRGYQNLDVPIAMVSVPNDQAAVERGQHIAMIYYCGSCHAGNLSGNYLIDDPAVAVIPAPNLTGGEGGVGAFYTDEDWVRAIRHGVGRDGRGLIGMPSRVWFNISDEDLGDLIAYLKTIPPVDNPLPERKIGPMFRLLLALGQAPAAEATMIDHESPRPFAPVPGVTAEYGEYLAQGCTACHGANLNGGTVRDFEGELMIASNLTPGGELAGWSEADFFNTIRTGVDPEGERLNSLMPWPYLGQMTDEELGAIWLYLQTLPAMEQGMERTDL